MDSDEPFVTYDLNKRHLSSGKALGGTSTINTEMYIRGNPLDFDLWAEQVGNEWNYTNLLPYFKRIETSSRYQTNPDYHGNTLLQALNKEDPTLLDRILWTNEAPLQTNGRVNRHNCVYWSDTNPPHFIIEPRVIVWGEIWSGSKIIRDYLDDTFVITLDWASRNCRAATTVS